MGTGLAKVRPYVPGVIRSEERAVRLSGGHPQLRSDILVRLLLGEPGRRFSGDEHIYTDRPGLQLFAEVVEHRVGLAVPGRILVHICSSAYPQNLMDTTRRTCVAES